MILNKNSRERRLFFIIRRIEMIVDNRDIRMVVREFSRGISLKAFAGHCNNSIYIYVGKKSSDLSVLKERVSQFREDTLVQKTMHEKNYVIDIHDNEGNVDEALKDAIKSFQNNDLISAANGSSVDVYIITDMNDEIYKDLDVEKFVGDLSVFQNDVRSMGIRIRYICIGIINLSRIKEADEFEYGKKAREFLMKLIQSTANSKILHIPRMVNDKDLYFTSKTVAFITLMISLGRTEHMLNDVDTVDENGYTWTTISLYESNIRAFMVYKLCISLLEHHTEKGTKTTIANDVSDNIGEIIDEEIMNARGELMKGISADDSKRIPYLLEKKEEKIDKKVFLFIKKKESVEVVSPVRSAAETAMNDLENIHKRIITKNSEKVITNENMQKIAAKIVKKCERLDDIGIIPKVIDQRLIGRRSESRVFRSDIGKYDEGYEDIVNTLGENSKYEFCDALYKYVSEKEDELKEEINSYDISLIGKLNNAMGMIFKSIKAEFVTSAIKENAPLGCSIDELLNCIDLEKVDNEIEDNTDFEKVLKEYVEGVVEGNEASVRTFNGCVPTAGASLFTLYLDRHPGIDIKDISINEDKEMYRKNVIQLLQYVKCDKEASKSLPYFKP